MEKPKIIRTYEEKASVYALTKKLVGKPVIVFIPGLGDAASNFFENNPMFYDAVNCGFNAAVVNFDFPNGKSLDMWHNGNILAKQISDICSYFNVRKVTAVAHSKGGVDAQTAAVHCGAHELFDSIITLATPHWGSQLADIAYSTVGWALAELIKAHSPGCFSMQTAYMSEFRKITDSKPTNIVPIKTFAGNGGADELTRMWFSSILLDKFGENDGVVTVKNAQNPKGQHIGTFPYNHAQMGNGNFIWKHLEPVLKGKPVEQPIYAACSVLRCPHPAHILKGGNLVRGVDDDFFIDSTIESFVLTITASGDIGKNQFNLISPGGLKKIPAAKNNSDGTVVYRTEVKKPQTGKWKLSASPCAGAYTALVCLKGRDAFAVCPKSPLPNQFSADIKILRTYAEKYDVVAECSFKNGDRPPKLPELKNGVYNLELRLHGELDDGSKFERTLIRPTAAIKNLLQSLS